LEQFAKSSGFVKTVNNFKSRLDKFWSDQEVLYDYNADLHDIRNCSIIL